MDKVTQQSAANAEESASASEELNAQAEQMQVFVADLVAVVGGRRNGGGNHHASPGRESHSPVTGGHKRLALTAKPSRKGGKGFAPGKRPAQVIPLNEEEFKNF